MFEIQVNGIPRTYRDREDRAIDAGQLAKGREKAEIKVIDMTTGKWLIIADQFSPVGAWKDGPALTVVRKAG
jgi:hypothetical protein